MSKQKMHCDLRRSSSDRPKVSDRGKGFSPRKSLEQNLKASTEERQAASIICGNPNLRHCIVKFLIVKPDGHWGLLALPILCPGNSNYLRCGAQTKMDDFIMVSPPVDSFKAGQRKGGTGSLPDAVCSNKSLTDGHHQSGKPTRLDEFSKCDTAGTISDDFDAVNSSGASSDSSKARKNAKKNAKRRARKKAKRKNKRSSETGSTGLETLSEECAVGSSTSESSINNDIDHGDETVSSPDRLITANDSGGESNGVAGFSISKGLEDEHGETIRSFDMSSDGFSGIPDSLPLGSVSVGCTNEEVKILKCYNVETNLASNSEETNRSEVKFFPENRQSRRRSFSTKAGSKASARIHIQENEFSVFPELGNVRKGSGSVTFELDRIESRDSMNTTNLHEQQSADHLRPLIGEEVAEPDKEASPSENGEQEHSSASVLRKWKPVLGKDSGFANNSVEENPSPDYQKQISSNESEIMRVDHRSGNANRSSPEDKSSVQRTCTRKQLNDLHLAGNRSTDARIRADLRKNSVEENPSSNSENQISSNEFEIMRVDQRSGNANRSSPDNKSPVQNACTPKQVNCSTDARKEKHVYAFRADLRKNSVEENPSSNSQKQISSNESEIMRVDHRSGNVNRSSPEDKSSVQNACTPKQLNCSTDARKEKHIYAFRADSSKNSVEENPSEISLNESEIMRVDHRSGNANRSSPEDKSPVQNACTPKQVNCSTDSTDARKEKHVYSFRADSSKNSVEENPSEISLNESEIMRVDHRSGNANRSSPEDKSPVQNACTPKQVNCSTDSTDARKEKHVYSFRADSSKNSVEENPSEISLNESEIMRVDHRSGNANRSSPEDKSSVQNACTPKQLNCSTDARKEKHVYSFRSDSSEISGAFHDSYRVQQLSESVHLATGNPIAEFEKLLHAASPIICRSNVVNICRTCSQDDVGRPLCPHEVPDIALKSLWKWYEKRSSYGLGVRLADNDHSMRSGFRRSTVQAYFVPYLSAVQLFKKPENRRMNDGRVDSRTCEVDKTSERSSNVGRLPIFKVLVPRPGNQIYSSQGSSMSESVDTATTDDLEILFEYFESDQPQLRKPLFEKIRELVRGDGPSWYKPYGDPTKLESMNLDELHRSSWYSVAWYPIYRIPDGEFRAAFLTYHSFCHLVRRGSEFDSRRKDACIVSPVVGLQSYSAQRERWFYLKRSIPGKNEETSSLKPSEILRDRLKTLEQTSSLLARAEVRKGKVRSMNRHPDFEFFVSRRRW